ncbi:hypothetical protein EC973_009556 [Apophysomyces ossiformis]|uniref:JmjC domain-containing protein n=1 Tax=Apophysomyces ossiformis TaxID=679940 RepID=A0A8H7BNY7_9FUNG|nr:hypothetical protein EC973_009556 [Apophysomyces ossiformis]
MAKLSAKSKAQNESKAKIKVKSENVMKNKIATVVPIVAPQAVQQNLLSPPESLALQNKTCLNSTYKSFLNRCRACVAKKNDICRFRDLRAFEEVGKELKYGPYFVSTTESDNIRKRTRGISAKSQSYRNYLRKTIRNAFVKMVLEDMNLASQCGQTLTRRPAFSDIRHVCDLCLTSIFNLYWMCGVCGLDLCPACYQEDWSGRNLKLKTCTYRRAHTREHMIPIVKYDRKTIDQLYTEAMNLDNTDKIEPTDDHLQHCFDSCSLPENATASMDEQQSSTYREELCDSSKLPQGTTAMKPCVYPTNNDASFQDPVIEISKECHKISSPKPKPGLLTTSPASDKECIEEVTTNLLKDVLNLDVNQVTLEIFQKHWALGKPVVVQNLTKIRKKLWTPEYFQRNYGNQFIEVTDCHTGDVEETTVGQFFNGFADHTKRPGYNPKEKNCRVLKIKVSEGLDWPPKADFKTEFPELYRNFMHMLPIPEYCTSKGYFNLSNRLPKEYVPPDLGPKMFIAYGSTKDGRDYGTTKLHCDMADAVNVMCYAHIVDTKASATWDIYPSESLSILREFAAKIAKERGFQVQHPIHSQWIYLDDELQDRLWQEYGIKSWRVHQNVGDAVFIPAGCAHQVANNHSAIKCAYDFISPECVERAGIITKEFSQVPREDALQLNNTLLFAWTSSNA